VSHTSLRARIVGWLTALGGVLLIVSTLPFLPDRIVDFSELVVQSFGFRVTGHVVSLLVGILLVFLAGQLGRRKHRAWQVALVLFSVSLVVNLVRLDRFVSVVFAAVMLVGLIVTRREFQAPPDPPTLFQFVRFVPLYLLSVLAYGGVYLVLLRNRTSPDLTFSRTVDTVVSGMIGQPGAYTFDSEFFERVLRVSLLGASLIGVAIALALLFRPIVARPQQEDGAWEHASRLVHSYGDNSLAYFALRDDKSFFFSSDGEAMIAYTYIGRYALGSGDPIGRPESIELVVDEFLAMCRQRAWGVAFLAVLESDRDRYLNRGLHTFYLGDEAVVDCRGFSLSGKKWKSIRQSAQRVERTYRFEFMAETEASPGLIADLNALSAKWRGKAPERGFTMSLSKDLEGTNPEFRLCVALDEDDKPGGFLRIIPIFGGEPGFTLDLMRRDPDTPNGMTEFLLTRAIMHLDELGYSRLSMNFAVWGRLFYEDIHYTLTQRVMKQLLELVNPFYQIKSLKMFNQRFYPEWVPRVIVYDDVRALPRVGLLYGGVEGFLSIPVIGRYFLPRTVPHEKVVARPEGASDQ
jgi:lysyl-tRNA synthetase class 2